MKRFSLLFLALFLLQSCFYTRKAREIEVYDLDQNESKSRTSFVFEYPGKEKEFEKKSIGFFRLDEVYMPYNFTTNRLYSNEELNVYIARTRDKDVMVNIIGFLIRESLKTDRKNKNGKEEDPNPDTTYHYYIHVQVTDKDGNDVLNDDTMRSKAIINQLIRYKNYLN